MTLEEFDVDVVVRFLGTAFFAVVFVQSALDKIFDSKGNLAFFGDHFKSSPFPAWSVPLLFWVLTSVEAAAGVLCVAGLVSCDWMSEGFGLSAAGVAAAGLALLSLLLGQRLAKDYAGAAVIAAYFAVALLALDAF